MLDKEVIKFTRNGIRQENLATGETKMLTESDYARQFQYSPDAKEQLYQGEQGNLPVNSGGVPFYRAGSPNKHGDPRPSTANQSYTYGQYDTTKTRKANPTEKASGASQTRYYYTYRETGSKIHTHSDLRSNQLKHIQGKMIRQAGYAVLNNLNESDNAALRAVGKTTQSAIRMKQGYRHLKALWNRNSVFQSASTVRNTEFAASKNSAAYKAAYARQNAARATKTSQETVKQAGKAVQSIAKAVINPATLKAAAIAGAVLLVLLIIMQISDTAASAVVGSVTDHPELTVYVMQLDADFQDKITSLKDSYGKAENTEVTVDGEDLVNTDPNALAILATGDWTVIDLTPENKEELSKLHAILNTYSVSTTDEKMQESSGDGKSITKTIHHVTIKIAVYTAKEKINSMGFSDDQKKHVLQTLDIIDQIGVGAQGTSIGTGGQGSVAQGEFIWAVPKHTYISSGYGIRVDPINGQPSAFHTGLDIPAPTGTAVVASADGTIIRAGVNGGFGNCVIIQHRNGIQTLYGHNSALLVKVGDVVKQGQVIAKVGQTGRATGPHSHFEFRINGKHVDPAPYLKGILGNEE